MKDWSRITFRLAATVLMLSVLGYYIWTAATNGTPLVQNRDGLEYFKVVHHDQIVSGEPHYGYYNLMADSFLAGKLSLLVEPPPELLSLPNPLDPQANSAFRLADASVYKGRFHLYFGPVPALSLFIPFRLLPFGKITEPFAVALFGFGAFLFAALILVRLARKFRPAVSDSLLLLAILALGISNAMPFVLRRPVVYEVAITAGAFFLMLGFFLLVRSWLKETVSRWTMVLLSLCWGLAVGCRVLYVFAGVGLLIIWILLLAKSRERTVRKALVDGLCLCLPFALCVFALGLYNLARFDSWTEFGVNHQLTMGVIPREAFFRPGNLKPGLFLNVLRSPQPDIYFPFFRLRINSPIGSGHFYHSVEPIGGFLLTSPIMIFLFAGWRKSGALGILALVGLMAGMGLGILCFEAFLLPGASMRYQLDFIFPLIVTALLFWLLVDASVQSIWARIAFRCVSIVLILYGIIVHLCLGFTGYNDSFRQSHPAEYAACEKFAAPISRLLWKATTLTKRPALSASRKPAPAAVPTAAPVPTPVDGASVPPTIPESQNIRLRYF